MICVGVPDQFPGIISLVNEISLLLNCIPGLTVNNPYTDDFNLKNFCVLYTTYYYGNDNVNFVYKLKIELECDSP